MYTGTTEGFNNIISGSSRHFYCKLSREGEEHTTGFRSVKISCQSNTESDKPSIGGTVSTTVEISMDKPSNSLITGKEYQLSFGLEVDGTVEYCPICKITAEKPKEDDGVLKFTAYDRMVSKFNYPYFTDITSYPVDGKKILQEISTKTGVAISNMSELPDGKMIDYRKTTGEDENTSTARPFDGYTYREAIKYLAQIYGTFAIMGRTGELEFRWYTESGYIVDLNRSMNDAVSNEVIYTVQKIECTVDQKTLISGSGVTGMQIENPVMTQALLDSVFQKVGGMSYLPTTVTLFGDCRLDLGDIVTVKTKSGTDIKLPIMSIVYEFDGGLSTEIGSYGSTEEEESTSMKGPIAQAIDRVYTDLFLVKEVLANKVSTEYLEANYATITQLNVVEAKIDKIVSTDITVEYLEAHYAQIDMENVDTAVIRQGFLENLMVSQGIIADRVVGTEVVATDVLTGVNIYADDITAGTLSVDRLVLRGTDKSLVYALNNSGELVSTQVDTLDAYILTERTITADKIVAESITASEISSSAITAEKIASNAVTASKVEAGAITSAKIEAGAVTADKITVDSLEAIVAKIGGFTINSKAIYKGTDSRSSTVAGIYLGTDAIRAYASENAYTHIENGILTCDGANIKGDMYCDSAVYLLFKSCYVNGTEIPETGSYIPIIRQGVLSDNEGYLAISMQTYCNFIHANNLRVEDRIRLGGTASSGEGTTISSESIYLKTTNADSNYSSMYGNGKIYCTNWFRSTGKTGWYNETYGGGIYMADTTWVRVSHNKGFLVDNIIRGNNEIQTTGQNSYRMVWNSYGTFWRNDGSNLYLMITNSGDQYGGYGALRPFTVNFSTGQVTMLNSLHVGNGIFWWDGSADRRVVYSHNNGIYSLASANGYMELSTNQGAKGLTWWDSDARLKKNIESTTENALEVINKIQHYSFDWKDETHKSIKVGYVAQQLEEIEELFVLKVDQTHISEENECEYDYTLQVDETHIIPYITKAIQELSTQVEELKNQIATMQQGAV